MDAIISNGLGSDYIVLTSKNEIQSGVICLFPASDRLALDAMQYYCNQLPDEDTDKATLRHWLKQLYNEWTRMDKSNRWETP